MPADPPPAPAKTVLVALLLLAGVLAAIGCESSAGRSLHGARLYTAGSEAMARGETVRAVALLEEAAVLVPHASEIQNHLGLAYWSAGRTVEARVAFTPAVELDCENRAAQGNLARLERGEPITAAPSNDRRQEGG